MTYADHPAALQLRAMNIIYETTKERGATILIPTSMVDSLNPVVALALAGQVTASQKTNGPLPLSPGVPKESAAAALLPENLLFDAIVISWSAMLPNCASFIAFMQRLGADSAHCLTHHAGISNLASLLGLGPGFLRHA